MVSYHAAFVRRDPLSVTCNIFLPDRNQFLFKINNEAKVRRSTRLVMLGKAKVMSFKDLEEAKARRAKNEDAITKKGQRNCKRKDPVLQAPAGSRVVEGEVVNEALAATSTATQWKAPIARMY